MVYGSGSPVCSGMVIAWWLRGGVAVRYIEFEDLRAGSRCSRPGGRISVDWFAFVSYAWLNSGTMSDAQDSEGGPIVSANWEADRRLGNHPQSAASAAAIVKTWRGSDGLAQDME